LDLFRAKPAVPGAPLEVVLIGTPDVIDKGLLAYLFSMKSKDVHLQKFFESAEVYRKMDYAILTEKHSQG